MSDYFGAVDYIVLISMFILSLAIGIFFAYRDYRKKTNEESFLRGGQDMSILPVSISIMASFLSSTSFIGFPVVVYITGSQIWVIILPSILAAILAAEIFIPLPSFGVEMFAPAIALSIVTDMSITGSIFIIGLIVTIYTSLGGLKGVIWTDFFQFGVMVFGLVAVIVRGANVSGGMAESFKKAYVGGRIEFWNMDFDIYQINSFWNFILGCFVLWAGTFATSQLQVQRSVCMPTLKSAKTALYCAIPGIILMISLTILSGIVMYARYYDCDPMLTGRVKRADQLLPYFVLDIFEDDYKGLPGMFVACIFCSSLSTISSGLNGMATIIWHDYGKRLLHRRIPEKYNIYITKVLSAAIGIISIGIAFGIKESNNIVEVAVSIYGASIGPMFGAFCLGLFFPWANKWGAGAGLITGQIMCLWITIGGVSDRRNPQTMMLGLSTDKCAEKNISVYVQGDPVSLLTNYKIPDYYPEGIDILHHISPYFLPVLGFLISLLLGNLISVLTKGNVNRKVDKDLVHIKICCLFEKLLPESWRQFKVVKNQDTSGKAFRIYADFSTKIDVFGEMNGSKDVDTDAIEDKGLTLPLRTNED